VFEDRSKIETEQLMALKCTHCGASLEIQDKTKEFITCTFCATTQKMLDVKSYLDQIRGDIYSWVSAAIPQGFDLTNADNVDPIARHNIFINNIKPRLETEYGEYKFNSYNLFSNMLIVPPFQTNESITAINTAKETFEFNAKIKSIEKLAIDDESKQTIKDADGITTAYAYILTNLELISEDKSERFDLMSRNFEKAAKLLKENEKYTAIYQRLQALYNTSMGTRYLLNGNLYNAKYHLLEAQKLYESCKTNLMNNFELGIMSQAIDKEIAISNAINCIVIAAENDPLNAPLETVAVIENISKLLNIQKTYEQGNWNNYLRDETRCCDIFQSIMDARKAQNGEQTIKTVGGNGSVLLPFWVVDLPYSFKTGSLWMKKGVEVIETMLVSAGFTSNVAILNQPSLGLTDIFNARTNPGFINSISGKETSISGGGGIKDIVNSATLSSASGRKIIPPLSTKKEAGYLVENYIDQTRKIDRVVAEKLRLSSPRVIDLIYIPGELDKTSFELNVDLTKIKPNSMGNLEELSSIIM